MSDDPNALTDHQIGDDLLILVLLVLVVHLMTRSVSCGGWRVGGEENRDSHPIVCICRRSNRRLRARRWLRRRSPPTTVVENSTILSTGAHSFHTTDFFARPSPSSDLW